MLSSRHASDTDQAQARHWCRPIVDGWSFGTCCYRAAAVSAATSAPPSARGAAGISCGARHPCARGAARPAHGRYAAVRNVGDGDSGSLARAPHSSTSGTRRHSSRRGRSVAGVISRPLLRSSSRTCSPPPRSTGSPSFPAIVTGVSGAGTCPPRLLRPSWRPSGRSRSRRSSGGGRGSGASGIFPGRRGAGTSPRRSRRRDRRRVVSVSSTTSTPPGRPLPRARPSCARDGARSVDVICLARAVR